MTCHRSPGGVGTVAARGAGVGGDAVTDKTPWIVVKSGVLTLCCLRCGVEIQPRLPMSIPDYLGASDDFVKRHRKCKEQPK